MRKSLSDISWQVSESEYRADPALSYSILAKFEREGFEHLDTLFDKVESPSLLFGSCVDTLLTEGEQAFADHYFVSDIPGMKPSIEPIVKKVFDLFHNAYTSIYDIPDSSLMPTISEFGYQPNWKPETRCKIIRQEGNAYYQTMFMAKGKTVVPQDVYSRVFACVNALKNSEATQKYFKPNDPFEDIERFYQLKFRNSLGGIDYRCMADLILVNHKTREILPCDLKTSSHREYDFPKSFLQWRYDIQARLYWRLIRLAMDNDDYFKDFNLREYRFIVVNNIDRPTPLVWSFRQTQALGNITLNGNTFRDPENIGKELTYYLKEHPVVPLGISNIASNSIEQWFDNRQ